MRLLRLLPALLPLALGTGCATVLHGSHQKVPVETDPPGATASADGQTITTPGVLKLERRRKIVVVIVEKEGYISRRLALSRREWGLERTNWAFGLVGGTLTSSFAGVVALPLVAVGIDYATGAAYRLEPSKIVLRLEPVTVAATDSQ